MAATQVPWVTNGEAANETTTKRPTKFILTQSGMDVDTLGFTGFEPVFIPKAYGAAGNGVADDAAAINAAITAANGASGGRVVCAAANYTVSTHLIMKSKVTLYVAPHTTITRTGITSALCVYFGAGVSQAGIAGTGVVVGPDVSPTGISDGSVVIFEGATECWTGPDLRVQGGKVAGIALLSGSTNITLDRPYITHLNDAANQTDNADIRIYQGPQSGHRVIKPRCMSLQKVAGIGIQTIANGEEITDIEISGARVDQGRLANGHGIYGYVAPGGGAIRRVTVTDPHVSNVDGHGVYFIGIQSGKQIFELTLKNIRVRSAQRLGSGGTLLDGAISGQGWNIGCTLDGFKISGTGMPVTSYGVRLKQSSGVKVTNGVVSGITTLAAAVRFDSDTDYCTISDVDTFGDAATSTTGFNIGGTGHRINRCFAKGFVSGFNLLTLLSSRVSLTSSDTCSSIGMWVRADSIGNRILSHEDTSSATPYVDDAPLGSNSMPLSGSAATTNNPTAIGNTVRDFRVFVLNLTPAAIAANTSAAQVFAVPGLAPSGTWELFVTPPSITAGTAIVAAKVSSAGNISITFGNFTAGSLTPGSGSHRILAIRTG